MRQHVSSQLHLHHCPDKICSFICKSERSGMETRLRWSEQCNKSPIVTPFIFSPEKAFSGLKLQCISYFCVASFLLTNDFIVRMIRWVSHTFHGYFLCRKSSQALDTMSLIICTVSPVFRCHDCALHKMVAHKTNKLNAIDLLLWH